MIRRSSRARSRRVSSPSPSPPESPQSTTACNGERTRRSTRLQQAAANAEHGETRGVAAPSPASQKSSVRSVSFCAESPTIVNSQDSYQVSIPTTTAANEGEPPPEPEDSILPLIERVPEVQTVVEFMLEHHRIQGLLSHPTLFANGDDLKSFSDAYFAHAKGDIIPNPNSDEWFWEDACDFMFESLVEHIPSSRSDLKKCRACYFQDKAHLVRTHFRTRLLTEYSFETIERQRRLRNISGLIGEVFVEVYEQLTTPPSGKKIILIRQQLDQCIKDLSKSNLNNLFVDGIDQRIYYITGFLCRAGEKESERRSKSAESTGFAVGQCIKEVSDHFVSQKSAAEVKNIQESLPAGVTDLVDKWSVHGCLKYPDRQLYLLMAKIEYCYVNLATPQNLRTYGGIVLSYICGEITTNEYLVSHFRSLLREDEYTEATIISAFRYYVKVFGNLRAKDLSRKLNAQLHKSTTAALRPSLATKGEKKKSKRSKAKSKSTVEKRPADKSDDVDETEEEINNALIDIASESVDGESDDEYIP